MNSGAARAGGQRPLVRSALGAVAAVSLLALAVSPAAGGEFPASAGAGSVAAVPSGFCFSDLHNSVLYQLHLADDLAGLSREGAPVSLRGLRQAEARFLFLSLGIPRYSLRQRDRATLEDLLAFLESFKSHVRSGDSDLVLVRNRHELLLALGDGKIAFALALEGTHLLRGEVAKLDQLYDAGVRMLGIAHWFHNEFIVPGRQRAAPDGAFIDDDSVLNPAGVALLERMIALGMIVDVSHARKALLSQIVRINRGRTRLVASHANARGVHDTPRNLSDAEARWIAATGGLIGVSLHRSLVAGDAAAGVAELVDHIVHLVAVAGPQHVALGTDYGGNIRVLPGLERVELIGRIAEEMSRRGVPEAVISRVVCENALGLLPE